MISELAEFEKSNDYVSVKSRSHKLRGSALNIGALRLSEIFGKIENDCASNDFANIKVLISKAEICLNDTLEELEKV